MQRISTSCLYQIYLSWW